MNPTVHPLRRLPLVSGLLVCALLLGSCGMIPGQGAAFGEATVVPTATLDPAGYRAIPTRACIVNDWATMQTNLPQGDLIAWQPGSHDLAYITLVERTSWFVGELRLAKAPDYSESISLAPAVLASGDLTWSPDGERLAFLAFRPNENLYTVMVVNADGSGLTDLFPTDAARTDARTSQKAVVRWKDEDTLEVISACGEACRNGYAIDLGSGSPELVPTPIGDHAELREALQINRRMIEYDVEEYPRVMIYPDTSLPHFSPNDTWVAYLDKRLDLWVLSPTDKTTFPVDLGLREVYETQWSSDEARLAVRAEDRIFVFDIPCDK